MDAYNQQYLTFVLGQEVYAVDILAIREIIEHGQLTEVPLMPSFVRGVINLRGRVVPVVDLQARFGRVPTELDRRSCIVILEMQSDEGRQDIGILVEAVNEVIDIPSEEIEPTPGFGTGIRAQLIQGMGKVNGKFVIILNLDRLVSAEHMLSVMDVNGNQLSEDGVPV